MLKIDERGLDIGINFNNKISISRVNDIACLIINGESFKFSALNPVFLSSSISPESDDLLNGVFTFSNGLKIEGENSIKLQKKYLKWEFEQLNRTQITFKFPESRDDTDCGVVPFHPYFFAIVNRISRQIKGFDLIGFGQYLTSAELKFVHQYTSFHPQLRNYIASKDHIIDLKRVMIPCRIFELLIESALAHVDGYRDKIRFTRLFEDRNIQNNHEYNESDLISTKFLMEYGHVLESQSIWEESFDFHGFESSGGLLDVLNLPF